MFRTMICLIAAAALAGCAFTPHQVGVTASAPKDASTIGEGTALFVEVFDDRDSTVVGQRGVGMQGADITAPQVIPAVERELRAGFEAKGFRIVDNKTAANARVEARLRAFKFFIESGFWTGAENTDVVIAVEARNGADDYKKVYRMSGEESAIVVPGGDAIDQKLNAGLTQVLGQIMRDEQLLQFLARRPPGS